LPQLKTSLLSVKTPFLDPSKQMIESFLREKFSIYENRSFEQVASLLKDLLPLIDWEFDQENLQARLVIVCPYRQGVSQFFYHLVTKCGIGGKLLRIEGFFTCDFTIEDVEGEKTYCQLQLRLDEQEFCHLLKNKKTIETEIRLGASSSYHAQRLGEFKGLSQDVKTQVIQEKIAALMTSRKRNSDPQIFSRMQKFLVNCSEGFKKKRDSTHLTRIISVIHLLRKLIDKRLQSIPEKRHIITKFLKSSIYEEGKKKNILGVVVGLNFIKKHEIFEESHLLKALRVFVPDIIGIKDSCFIDQVKEKKVQILYLEVEKEGHKEFSVAEIKQIKEHLVDKIEESIESLTHAIFMPRNEEEIYRSIVTLSHQVKYVHDIPQVIIDFQHKQEPLVFTVVLVRVLKEDSLSIEGLLVKHSSKISLEKERKVGLVRKKYPKQAVILKVVLPSKSFLRLDSSIDLYKARNQVISMLMDCFGDVRDYNGGMIDKQNHLLDKFKKSFAPMLLQHESLMEKFYFSIRPQEMRVMLEPEQLKNLFFLMVNLADKGDPSIKLLIKQEEKILYFAIKKEQKKVLQAIYQKGYKFRLVCSQITIGGQLISAFILRGESKVNQDELIKQLKQMV